MGEMQSLAKRDRMLMWILVDDQTNLYPTDMRGRLLTIALSTKTMAADLKRERIAGQGQ